MQWSCSRDVVNLSGNWSQTKFGVPYDSTGGISLDDHQKDVNSFVNLWAAPHFGRDTRDVGSVVGAVHGDLLPQRLVALHARETTPSFIFFPTPRHTT